jgi:ABC-type antimicrobial peptide transport system permease subunit
MSNGGPNLDMEIVGIVQNAKYSEVRQELPPIFFVPYTQSTSLGTMHYYTRTSLDTDRMLGAAPGVLSKLDTNLPVEDLKTMPQQVRENVFMDRMVSTLSAAFASLATLLAAVGLYGVLAYTVGQRTREIGLRMALGADAARMRAMILKQVGWMTLVGGAIGIVGAYYLGKGAESLLFEIKGFDPIVVAVAVAVLVVVAFGAGYIPAHRASRVHPMQALRYE